MGGEGKSLTIGGLRAKGQRLAIYCGKCQTMSYLTAEQSDLMPKVELQAMERFFPCPECGYCNSESEGPALLTVRPEQH
jgi:hypothetical protein